MFRGKIIAENASVKEETGFKSVTKTSTLGKLGGKKKKKLNPMEDKI